MGNFKHIVITDNPECLQNQTNKKFLVNNDQASIKEGWVIISYVRGKIHPQFIERIQSRFRPYPFELKTKGYKFFEGHYFEATCQETFTVINRPLEVSESLPKEHISDFLFCEETDQPDCIGDSVTPEEWMVHE